MNAVGFNQPLYILPFDHRGSFQTKMFGWKGTLSPYQTAEIAATKQVVYDGFKAAIQAGVTKHRAGILVDEQFGSAILRDAATNGYTTACPAEKSGTDCELGVDGGIDDATAPLVVAAGANVLVAGSSIFATSQGVEAAMESLRAAVTQVAH